MSDTAVRVRVTGRVQGVSYRWTCQVEAERHGVRGWVRNEDDGSVAGYLEGAHDAVDALVDWCRLGPSGARVDAVDVERVAVEGAHSFEVRG